MGSPGLIFSIANLEHIMALLLQALAETTSVSEAMEVLLAEVS